MDGPGQCSTCPTDKAICLGGSNIGPRPGYWRANNLTDEFIECNYSPACLGMVQPNNVSTGECHSGYQGILCSDCAPDYSRTTNYQCQPCPNKTWNGIRLTLILITVTLLIILMVRSTI